MILTNFFDLSLMACYLVGVKTSANIPKGSSDSFCRMGRANAAVLPLPVFAQPMQSFPGGNKNEKDCYLCYEYSIPIHVSIPYLFLRVKMKLSYHSVSLLCDIILYAYSF